MQSTKCYKILSRTLHNSASKKRPPKTSETIPWWRSKSHKRLYRPEGKEFRICG